MILILLKIYQLPLHSTHLNLLALIDKWLCFILYLIFNWSNLTALKNTVLVTRRTYGFPEALHCQSCLCLHACLLRKKIFSCNHTEILPLLFCERSFPSFGTWQNLIWHTGLFLIWFFHVKNTFMEDVLKNICSFLKKSFLDTYF